MIVGVVLRARQTRGIARRDNRRLKAVCHIHNRREHVLHVRDPEIECPRAEHQLRTNRVREGNDPLVTVHRRKARAADPVELNPLRAVLLCQPNKLLRLADANDLADKRRQMPVDSDVDPALFECTDVDLRCRAMPDTKECIRRDVRRDHARVAERQTAAQELLHRALPVAVRAAACAVERIKHLVVRADGKNVELLPDLLTFSGCKCRNGTILTGDGTRKILKQHVSELAREALRRLPARLDAERLAHLTDALFTEQRQLQSALGSEFQRQDHLTRMCAMLCHAARRTAQEVAGNDEIGIRTADPARALRRDLARSHVAVLAADPRHAKGALRLLLVKAVERCVAADLLHVQQHLAHGGVGGLFENILLRRERLAIVRDRLHVVVHTAVDVRMCCVVRVRLPCAVLVRVIVDMTVPMCMVVIVMLMRMPVTAVMRVHMSVIVCVAVFMHVRMIVTVGVLMPVASCSRVRCHCPISYL